MLKASTRRAPESSYSKIVRETNTAVKTLAAKPIIKVIAKPFTGPSPNKNRKAHDTMVVTWVSTIVHQALPNPASTAAAYRLSGPQLFADALENQHVGIDRHTDGENDAGDARQRQNRAKIRNRRQQNDGIEQQRQHRIDAAPLIVNQHHGDNRDEADETGYKTFMDGIVTQ